MKSKAFTLIESLVVMFIASMLILVILQNLKPNELKKDAFIKAGKAMYIQIDFATNQIVMKATKNYTLTRIIDNLGEFSIADQQNNIRLANVYKRYLIGVRDNFVAPIEYFNKSFVDEEGNLISNLSPKDFTNYKLKNNSLFGLKLNGNCTTQENNIYNPTTSRRIAENSCGIIFLDINGVNNPNILGIDQFLFAIGKSGLK